MRDFPKAAATTGQRRWRGTYGTKLARKPRHNLATRWPVSMLCWPEAWDVIITQRLHLIMLMLALIRWEEVRPWTYWHQKEMSCAVGRRRNQQLHLLELMQVAFDWILDRSSEQFVRMWVTSQMANSFAPLKSLICSQIKCHRVHVKLPSIQQQ